MAKFFSFPLYYLRNLSVSKITHYDALIQKVSDFLNMSKNTLQIVNNFLNKSAQIYFIYRFIHTNNLSIHNHMTQNLNDCAL